MFDSFLEKDVLDFFILLKLSFFYSPMSEAGKKKRRDQIAIDKIGQNIRKHRKLQGLTIAELAFKMSVDPKQLSKMELGITDSNITMLTLVSLHLGISVAKLVEG